MLPDMPDSENLLSNVSRETMHALKEYMSLLLRWNRKINLIDKKTESTIWQRHIIDSAQLQHLIPQKAKSLIDWGAGAGLPGVVLAILKPELTVTCCERDRRKAIFLQEVARELKLTNLTVTHADIADINQRYDLITARAFAPLNKLLSHAIHHLSPNGICLFPKGKTHAKEVGEAQNLWKFNLQQVQSITNAEAQILVIDHLTRR
jgi:16S rRNA (guanine527-N7)-methyltransferase